VAPERGQPLAVGAPLLVAEEARALVERRRLALDAVGDLAVDHHRRAVAGEEVEVGAHRGDLVVDAAAREASRVPARHAGEPLPAEHLGERLRLARELVAELEALVADRLALGERGLERDVAASDGSRRCSTRSG
jgi:hypothetical protein